MKMNTRVFSLVLALMLFAMMAIGSGSSSGNSGSKTIVNDISDNDTIETDNSESTGKQESMILTIDEQVLVEQDGIKITAKEYVTDSVWGDGLKLLIENNSDTNVTVGYNALIVNNYMIADYFSSAVAAGKKANDTLYISSSQLESAGITIIGQIEIYFNIYDSDSWDTIFEVDAVTLKTSEYNNMDVTPNDTGAELYNANGIRIVGKVVDDKSFWGTAVLLYLENKTGNKITVTCENMSINGFMVTPYFSSNIYDGKMAVDDITILSSDLEENDIESVDDVELSFHIYNPDTYDTIVDTDPITFSAK